MGRFIESRYSPVDDSSVGFRTHNPQALVLAKRAGGCPCGCNLNPKGKRAVFRMGHDARLRGKLIRAHLTATKVIEIVDGKVQPAQDAEKIAEYYGWTRYLAAARDRKYGKSKEILRRALRSKRLIKVGRWSYTGEVVAVYETAGEGEFEIEYLTKTGEKRTARVPANKAPLAGKA